MKFKLFFSIAALSFILSCETKNEEIKVGEVVERSAEELASIKDYAPGFTLTSIDGKQVSLSDLKGKYVYVDVWATWCRPCLMQIPAMQELEQKYHGQNIEFLSISIDSDRDKGKWEKMVADKQMKGLQLFAGKSTSFQQDYAVSSIPKFILIGKEGEIIDNNPPRPLDHMTGQINQQLVSMIDNLLK